MNWKQTVMVTVGLLASSVIGVAIADYMTPLQIIIHKPMLKHGEMWNYTAGGVGYHFEITGAGVYYNISGLAEGHNTAFDHVDETQANGGSYLRANVAGDYAATFSMSFNSENVGGLYGFSIGHNWDQNTHRNCYARRTAASSVGSVSITCIMDVDVEDNISVMVENENGARDIDIHTANLNLIRIGVN